MKVPLLDLRPQNDPLRRDILRAIERVVDSQRYILGPEVDAFEEELAQHLGVRHAVGVSSGSDALLASLMVLGIGPGDAVLTTPFSFFATVGCIVRLGAQPVYADIDLTTFAPSAPEYHAALTPKVKALIAVHLFGRWDDAATTVPLIEDAAQSIGAGPLRGIAGCLSFFPSKNLGALGDGGAVYTNDDEFADAIRLLRQHGSRPKYVHSRVGGNFRLDALQAAVLRVKLPHLAEWTALRRSNAAGYERRFSACGDLPSDFIRPAIHAHHTVNQYVVLAPQRDALRRYLQQRGIDTEVYYPKPFHLQPCFATHGYRVGDFPRAEMAAANALALPVFPGLTAEQQDYVVEHIGRFYGHHGETDQTPTALQENMEKIHGTH